MDRKTKRPKSTHPPLSQPEKLAAWAGVRDPIVIAGMLDIPVHRVRHPESRLPGLTCQIDGRPSIFLNEAYFDTLMRRDRTYREEDMQNDLMQVAAHELGHACLHRRALRRGAIREYEIFNVRTRMEIEANQFAAGIRIDKNEMLDRFASEMDLLQVARSMQVNVNLLIYRIEMLRQEGMRLGELPYLPKHNCIGHIQAAGSPEWGGGAEDHPIDS